MLTIGRCDKRRAGCFNLESPAAIPEDICKELGGHKKYFTGRAIPSSCISWRFDAQRTPRQLPWYASSWSVVMVPVEVLSYPTLFQGVGYGFILGWPPHTQPSRPPSILRLLVLIFIAPKDAAYTSNTFGGAVLQNYAFRATRMSCSHNDKWLFAWQMPQLDIQMYSRK